jgi:hypothetical protein
LARLVKILVDTYIDPAIGRSVKIAGMDGDFREDSEELRKAFVRCSVVSRLTCAFVAACAVVPVPVVGSWSPQVPIARIVCVFKKDGSETWKLVRLWVGSFAVGTVKQCGDGAASFQE